MMAHVLGTAAGETSETNHPHLGGRHILATVAHDLKFVGLCWWLVANFHVLCLMENGDNTAEHLGIAAVKQNNNTHATDLIQSHLSQINCPCQ
jgi:hypothetical protein